MDPGSRVGNAHRLTRARSLICKHTQGRVDWDLREAGKEKKCSCTEECWDQERKGIKHTQTDQMIISWICVLNCRTICLSPRFSASQAFFFFALMLATLHPLKDRSMSLAASGRSSVSIGPQPEVKCSILTFMRIVVFEKWLSGAAAINDSALLWGNVSGGKEKKRDWEECDGAWTVLDGSVDVWAAAAFVAIFCHLCTWEEGASRNMAGTHSTVCRFSHWTSLTEEMSFPVFWFL